MENLTFDCAQDAFRSDGTTYNAQNYARIARKYHEDDMIGDDTLNAALREVDQFFIDRDGQ